MTNVDSDVRGSSRVNKKKNAATEPKLEGNDAGPSNAMAADVPAGGHCHGMDS